MKIENRCLKQKLARKNKRTGCDQGVNMEMTPREKISGVRCIWISDDKTDPRWRTQSLCDLAGCKYSAMAMKPSRRIQKFKIKGNLRGFYRGDVLSYPSYVYLERGKLKLLRIN